MKFATERPYAAPEAARYWPVSTLSGLLNFGSGLVSLCVIRITVVRLARAYSP
jgi:hypothetical protein